ncbi:MAG TPA: Spy/CpxP family protein refolding chaperone [Oculatellaceae cyanobacterium]|jgi:Spy/CpxP family protein refolding chaperone
MLLRRISVVSLLMVSLGSAVAIAQPNPQSPQQGTINQRTPRQMNRSWGALMQQLNLSTEQIKQLSDIRQQYQGQISQKQRDLREAKNKLTTLMVGTANDSTIRDQFTPILRLEQEIAQLQFDNLLAMRKVLTPEQRSKFAELMQQRGKMSGNRLGNSTQQKR